VKFQRVLLSVAVCAALAGLAGCKPKAPAAANSAGTASEAAAKRAADIENETADQFIARVNKEMHDDYREITAAAWLGDTYINEDSQLVSSKANERALAKLGDYVAQSKKFDGTQMSPETARAMQLLRLGITVPPPKDPAHLAELTAVGTKMSGDYGAGKWCPDKNNPASCKDIGQIEDVLSDVPNRSYDEQLQAWEGGRLQERDRPPVEPGQAAVREPAVLHQEQAGGEVRRAGRGQRHDPGAPDRQPLAAGLEQPVAAGRALSGRGRDGRDAHAAAAA
jgi:peptidyl-dipeptidase A